MGYNSWIRSSAKRIAWGGRKTGGNTPGGDSENDASEAMGLASLNSARTVRSGNNRQSGSISHSISNHSSSKSSGKSSSSSNNNKKHKSNGCAKPSKTHRQAGRNQGSSIGNAQSTSTSTGNTHCNSQSDASTSSGSHNKKRSKIQTTWTSSRSNSSKSWISDLEFSGEMNQSQANDSMHVIGESSQEGEEEAASRGSGHRDSASAKKSKGRKRNRNFPSLRQAAKSHSRSKLQSQSQSHSQSQSQSQILLQLQHQAVQQLPPHQRSFLSLQDPGSISSGGTESPYVSAEFTLASGSAGNGIAHGIGTSRPRAARLTSFRSTGSSRATGDHSGDLEGRSKNRTRASNDDDDDEEEEEEASSFTGTTPSVMMDKQRAVNVGRSGTKFVYAVLFCTGLLLSVATFLFVRHSEHQEFESEFHSYARETAALAETNAAHTFSQFQTLATTLTSAGLFERDYSHRLDYTDASDSHSNSSNSNKREREREIESRRRRTTSNHENQYENDDDAIYRTGAWPNVTIPHFDQRIEVMSQRAGATMIMYVPLVEDTDKDGFEAYANARAPWRTRERSDATNQHQGTGTGTGYVEIFPCPNGHSEEDRDGFVDVDSFMEEILSETGGFANPDGLVAPIYQYGGPNPKGGLGSTIDPKSESIALMDLWHHPIFKKEVVASIEYGVPVISEYLDVGFLLESLSPTEPTAAVGDPLKHATTLRAPHDPSAKSGATGETTLSSVMSITLDPVKESFEQGARTIGFVVGIVPWSTFFRNVLEVDTEESGSGSGNTTAAIDDDPYTSQQKQNKAVRGIVVKVVSDCGSVFTLVLSSENHVEENPVRFGDWKERYGEYEDLNHTSRFFWKEHPKGKSRHCHFDLQIYPSEEFRNSYRTKQPWLYALAVVAIFVFTAGIFAGYDAFVFQGQRHIVTEATGMIVENARRAARNERDLNDFIAHEVRNPLAAALSACAFVMSALTEDQMLHGGESGKNRDGDSEGETEASDIENQALIPADERRGESRDTNDAGACATDESIGKNRAGGDLETAHQALISSDEKRDEVIDDVKIINESLHFINDLLRNMLDMQRAGSNQIPIEIKPTDIMNDIFKPVEAMMHLREVPFEVVLECGSGNSESKIDEDDQLVIMTDPLRLKQVVVNLTSNASRFVEKGFIRCSAKVNATTGFVELYVDDSGPGIPEEKRKRVFGKFQQSLDSLQQGTGIGLSLCKKLIDLMGGNLYIDDDYHSGIEGCPGTRFVIQLGKPPLQLENAILDEQLPPRDRAKLRRRLLNYDRPSAEDGVGPQPQAPPHSVDFAVEQPKTKTSVSSHSTVSTLATSENTGNESAPRPSAGAIGTRKEPATPPPVPSSSPVAVSPDPGEAPAEKAGVPASKRRDGQGLLTELPLNLSVLFVDDDTILRKLFSRTLKKINPTWSLREASSGEIAIELITSQEAGSGETQTPSGFDLIFMDQYMASTQKQLLGTETVRAIRARGFHEPIICGLSANDVEDAFFNAGCDAFMFKPFPCKKEELTKELLRIINTRRS